MSSVIRGATKRAQTSIGEEYEDPKHAKEAGYDRSSKDEERMGFSDRFWRNHQTVIPISQPVMTTFVRRSK
jgi:hypothetical protein